jgi:hypothetical protein
MMYYSVDCGYECAPVIDREVRSRWPRFPTVSLLVVMNDRPAIRCNTNPDPLVANLIFYHSSGNRLRFGIHYFASLLKSRVCIEAVDIVVPRRRKRPLSPQRIKPIAEPLGHRGRKALRTSSGTALAHDTLLASRSLHATTNVSTFPVIGGRMGPRRWALSPQPPTSWWRRQSLLRSPVCATAGSSLSLRRPNLARLQQFPGVMRRTVGDQLHVELRSTSV